MSEMFIICRNLKHAIWLYREFVRLFGDDIVKKNNHTREVQWCGTYYLRFITEEASPVILKGRRNPVTVSGHKFEKMMTIENERRNKK